MDESQKSENQQSSVEVEIQEEPDNKENNEDERQEIMLDSSKSDNDEVDDDTRQNIQIDDDSPKLDDDTRQKIQIDDDSPKLDGQEIKNVEIQQDKPEVENKDGEMKNIKVQKEEPEVENFLGEEKKDQDVQNSSIQNEKQKAEKNSENQEPQVSEEPKKQEEQIELGPENLQIMPLQRLQYGKKYKEQGTNFFRKQDYENARNLYEKAMAYVEPGYMSSPQQQQQYMMLSSTNQIELSNLQVTLLTNQSLCNFKLKDYKKSLNLSLRAISMDQTRPKSYWRAAEGYEYLNQPRKAFEYYKKYKIASSKKGLKCKKQFNKRYREMVKDPKYNKNAKISCPNKVHQDKISKSMAEVPKQKQQKQSETSPKLNKSAEVLNKNISNQKKGFKFKFAGNKDKIKEEQKEETKEETKQDDKCDNINDLISRKEKIKVKKPKKKKKKKEEKVEEGEEEEDSVILDAVRLSECSIIGISGVKYILDYKLNSLQGIFCSALLGTQAYYSISSQSQTARTILCLSTILTAIGLKQVKNYFSKQ